MVTVLEERSDYTAYISSINDPLTNLQEQIDGIVIYDYTSDVSSLND
jgi:hypothetical protein